MTQHIPPTPLSTRLSGSAKETELRIRSIFQGPKGRPPLWVMALAVLLIALCGGLVSCQPAQEGTDRSGGPGSPAGPSILMETQYYDVYENYIEIPALTLPDGEAGSEAVGAINQALDALRAQYQPLLEGRIGYDSYGLSGGGSHCLFFPSTTDRYLNLLFFQEEPVTDLKTGHVRSLVYDRKEHRQVTLEDALGMAQVTRDILFAQLSDQVDAELALSSPDYALCIHDPALDAFRMGQDGKPLFYLTARVDDADDAVLDAVSGADHLYVWSGGAFTRYDQYTLDRPPLVPAEETDPMSPPLFCQWHYEGGQPEGGFFDPEVAALPLHEQALLDTLLAQVSTDGLDNRAPLVRTLLASVSGDGYTLAAASIQDFYPHYSLVLGAVDSRTGALLGPVFETGAYGILPQCVSITRYDGTPALLYTANGMHQGLSWGEAGLVSCDGGGLNWAWPAEGDLREEGSRARADYDAYWEDHLALLAPGGVEVFTPTGNAVINGDGPQWSPDHNELFYHAPEEELPMPVYYQTRVWLEEFTRDGNNPYYAANASAAWRILSLSRADAQYPGQSGGEDTYLLRACADGDDSDIFSAVLLLDREEGVVSQVLFWNMSLQGVPYLSTGAGDQTTGVLHTQAALSWSDGRQDWLLGPGSTYFPFDAADWSQLPGWPPIASLPGTWSCVGSRGLYVLCYQPENGVPTAVRVDCARAGLETPRGIHPGSTRAEVLAAYPEASDAPYRGYTGDYLWYQSDPGFVSPDLLFFFEGNTVSRITLTTLYQ